MAGEGFFIDHVIYGVVDVDRAAERLRDEYGLGSVPGGIHLGGTTNRIVPLEPPLYLELLGVGDPSLADAAWLEQALGGQDRVLWWVLGTEDLDATAARRGLPVQEGVMRMAEGPVLEFRNAGMHRYPMPFFVEYGAPPEERLRRMGEWYDAAGHTCAPGGFTFVEVGEPAALLDGWLGDHGLPVRHDGSGRIGIRSVGIRTADGEVVIR